MQTLTSMAGWFVYLNVVTPSRIVAIIAIGKGPFPYTSWHKIMDIDAI